MAGGRSMAAALLLAVVLLALVSASEGKVRSNKKSSQSDRALRQRRQECEKSTCANFAPELFENCVLRCTSEACYREIFAGNELEEGEIDTIRMRQFNVCSRRDIQNTG
eukprot:tig00000806_g4381.t1